MAGPQRGSVSSQTKLSVRDRVHVWPDNHCTNLSPLEDEPPMKALFLGTLAASQAMPIIKFITADVRTEILDSNEPAQAAAALADADILLTGAWRSGFPAAPKLHLLQVPLAGTDGIDVSSLPRGVTLCNAYGHEPALGEFAIMMMLAWRHRLFDIAFVPRGSVCGLHNSTMPAYTQIGVPPGSSGGMGAGQHHP